MPRSDETLVIPWGIRWRLFSFRNFLRIFDDEFFDSMLTLKSPIMIFVEKSGKKEESLGRKSDFLERGESGGR